MIKTKSPPKITFLVFFKLLILIKYLHEVAAYDIQPPAAPNDLQPLNTGQSPDLRRPRPRGEGGVKAVDVKGDIHGPVPHHLADLRHQGGQGLVPAFLRHHYPEPLKEIDWLIDWLTGRIGVCCSDNFNK